MDAARPLRMASQIFALIGTLMLAFGLDIGAPRPREVVPGGFYDPGITIAGLPPALVSAEHPWMLSVGLWLVILGVACGLAGEIAEAWGLRGNGNVSP